MRFQSKACALINLNHRVGTKSTTMNNALACARLRTKGVVPGGDDEHHAEGLRRDPRRRRERQQPAGDLQNKQPCRYNLLLQDTPLRID